MSVDADHKRLTKKKRSTANGRFHRIYGRLLEGIQDELGTIVVEKILQDLETAYTELEARHEVFLGTFDSESEEDKPKINELNHDLTGMYRELCKSRSLCENLRQKIKHEQDSKLKEQNSMKHAKKNKDTETFRVKKLEAPIFAGSIRDYPSFKVDYERHMLSSYGKDPYALKQCLSGEALTVVKGVDNDFEEMFRRLDMKYGRAEKLIDHILNELKRLKKVQEGDNMKFISLVETVEKCWLDLKRMNLEAEMNTATMVSQIEKLLPPIQKREWALRKQKTESKSIPLSFKEFLNFLLEEKSALEYMESDLREYGTAKGKINTFDANESENDENNNGVAVDPFTSAITREPASDETGC
ncbi:unnamed protein product [Mytilus coruscus]|uniref:Uncharacterized protein n=1 Tax=Mytilus coruscus TaxID=42192 RepID=A0A6J8DAE4_MYTCO|nr:unnamed protein product [Mytilus coruscus]